MPGEAREQAAREHPIRAGLLHLVEAEPGIRLGDAAAAIGRGWGTFQHHLAVLEREGTLVRERALGQTRLFTADTPPETRRALALLANDGVQAVWAKLHEAPGAMQRDIAAALGVSAATVRRPLRALEAAGLVAAERDGHALRYRVSPDTPAETEGEPPRTRPPSPAPALRRRCPP